ncbi:MAG: hypothetical protein ACFFB6_09725 [Promethearchaeota archaeon]
MFQGEIIIGFYIFLYYFGWVCFVLFWIGFAVWIIYKFLKTYDIIGGIGNKSEQRYDYQNLQWLKYQYYDMEKSIQEIADDQGVSMMTITKWLDKIEKGKEDEDNANSTKIKTVGDQKKRSKKKRVCPYCRIFMKYYEKRSTYQCPRCKKKFQDIF